MKAVSPIVAVAFLVGVTLVVGGMVASFVTTVINTQQEQVAFAQLCSDAKVILQNGVYDASSDNLTLIVYNYGGVDLAFTPEVQYYDTSKHPNNQLLEIFPLFSIGKNEIKTVNLVSVEDDIENVRIRSAKCDPPCYQCPGAQDILLAANIRGL